MRLIQNFELINQVSDRSISSSQLREPLLFGNAVVGNDSLESGQRFNHRSHNGFGRMNPNYEGMRNTHLNNPFGRTFVIVNDHEDQGFFDIDTIISD